jgi:hypothetical protein
MGTGARGGGRITGCARGTRRPSSGDNPKRLGGGGDPENQRRLRCGPSGPASGGMRVQVGFQLGGSQIGGGGAERDRWRESGTGGSAGEQTRGVAGADAWGAEESTNEFFSPLRTF